MTTGGETARYRLRQARDALRASEFDALLLCGGANLNFLSGFPYVDVNLARPYFLVVSERDLTLLVHTGRFYEAERLSWVDDVRCYRRLSVAPIDELRQVLRDHGLARGRLGMELGYEQRLGLPVAEVGRLRAELAPLTIGDAAALLWQLRMVKAPWDVAAIRTACGITAAAYAVALRGISRGQREIDVLVAMEKAMRLGGGATPWVKITSGAGNYDVVLGPGTERILEPGDMVWMDGGCAVEGMWSDFGRAAVIGGPSPEQLDAQRAIREIGELGVSMVAPGVPVREIAAAVNQRVDAVSAPVTSAVSTIAGRVGHGIGCDVTEPPHISEEDPAVLAPGMIIAIEPGVATAYGLFHIEENVVVTEDGNEVLSRAPWELITV
jgi:Xaa-Pro dipeptidase